MSITSQSQLLPNLATVFGTIPMIIGLRGLTQPRALLATVGFPAAKAPEDQKVADGLTRLMAARNVAFSLLVWGIRYKGDIQLLGYSMLVAASYVFADTLISLEVTGKGWLQHGTVVPFGIALGAGLLGLLE
ncbi:hypothetical protein BX600DRAFT_539093 [Xylariales sp. PMI_506]|nr:hypothetical protein BX600DRAFT_539093 [Xylariales sp. PMI_506]